MGGEGEAAGEGERTGEVCGRRAQEHGRRSHWPHSLRARPPGWARVPWPYGATGAGVVVVDGLVGGGEDGVLEATHQLGVRLGVAGSRSPHQVRDHVRVPLYLYDA
jgi:hypothetical protein